MYCNSKYPETQGLNWYILVNEELSRGTQNLTRLGKCSEKN